ncbi:MAG: hypothetical protein Kow0031_21350 [Anaerolineae bacterium]
MQLGHRAKLPEIGVDQPDAVTKFGQILAGQRQRVPVLVKTKEAAIGRRRLENSRRVTTSPDRGVNINAAGVWLKGTDYFL